MSRNWVQQKQKKNQKKNGQTAIKMLICLRSCPVFAAEDMYYTLSIWATSFNKVLTVIICNSSIINIIMSIIIVVVILSR